MQPFNHKAVEQSTVFSLASRNTGDYQDCGTALIDPWGSDEDEGC